MPELPIPDWDASFPPLADLRADTRAMAEAVTSALIETLPAEAIRAIYFKGSAVKSWESPLDYVPDLSDIDLHIWFEEGSTDEARAQLADLDGALRRHELIQRRFETDRPTPAHVPRVQLVVMNDLLQAADYASSPRGTVEVLYGEPYPTHQLPAEHLRLVAVGRLADAADPATLDKLTRDLPECAARHVFLLLRQLSWRVSPIASRLLTVFGHGYETAWGTGRTQLLRRLSEHQPAIAELLVAYYVSAWDAYRSGWADPIAGRATFAAGIRALRAAREHAETY